jgi:hypothetical protein
MQTPMFVLAESGKSAKMDILQAWTGIKMKPEHNPSPIHIDEGGEGMSMWNNDA